LFLGRPDWVEADRQYRLGLWNGERFEQASELVGGRGQQPHLWQHTWSIWICRNQKRGIMKEQLEALIVQMYNSGIRYSESVREFKKSFILTALRENKGNRCKAARQLGMHRNTLSRAIIELEVDVKRLRAARDVRTLILTAPAGRISRIDPARPSGGQRGELRQFQDTCSIEEHFGSDREVSFAEQQISRPYRR